jgi:hypothetical protein
MLHSQSLLSDHHGVEAINVNDLRSGISAESKASQTLGDSDRPRCSVLSVKKTLSSKERQNVAALVAVLMGRSSDV